MTTDKVIRMDLVLEGILHPGEVDRFVAGATTTTPKELPGLAARVTTHLGIIEASAAERGIADIETARLVAASLTELLRTAADRTASQLALLRGAVEYFVESDDEQDDTEDIVGFDDDARIVSAVAEALDRHDLKVDPA